MYKYLHAPLFIMQFAHEKLIIAASELEFFERNFHEAHARVLDMPSGKKFNAKRAEAKRELSQAHLKHRNAVENFNSIKRSFDLQLQAVDEIVQSDYAHAKTIEDNDLRNDDLVDRDAAYARHLANLLDGDVVETAGDVEFARSLAKSFAEEDNFAQVCVDDAAERVRLLALVEDAEAERVRLLALVEQADAAYARTLRESPPVDELAELREQMRKKTVRSAFSDADFAHALSIREDELSLEYALAVAVAND